MAETLGEGGNVARLASSVAESELIAIGDRWRDTPCPSNLGSGNAGVEGILGT